MSNFQNIKIVGMHFRGEQAKEYASALQPGDELFAEREPDNPYDSNAIKVMALSGENLWHLAYINAEDAAWIGPEMDEGATFKLLVERVESFRNTAYPFISMTQHESDAWQELDWQDE